jgi:hypothetical protein
VLLRVQTHPAARIDELLPHYWTPGPEAPSRTRAHAVSSAMSLRATALSSGPSSSGVAR